MNRLSVLYRIDVLTRTRCHGCEIRRTMPDRKGQMYCLRECEVGRNSQQLGEKLRR